MFEKKATSQFKMEIEALHVPDQGAWSFYNTKNIKTASLDKTKSIDLGGFDLTAAVKENPDNLFVKVFAIKANEVNDNGDCFNEAELKKAAHTFVGVPVFVNHQNDNIENARGKVIHAWYDDSVKGIYCINMVDRAAYPRLARGIEEKYINGTSMGAQVGYSLCSICHNKAHTADEFCAHIKSGKNRKISGKYDCKFHESSSKPEDPCPLDGCKKGDKHELMHKEAKVYEWNFDIKFIEDSFVVNPACHDCLVCDILDVNNIKNKVAENIQQLKKVASSLSETVDSMNENSLEKTAGKSELQALSQAMNLMEHVARSMMAQKQQIQLDYASDLVEHMAKVQSLLDELTEMGYGQLPSPPEQDIAIGNILNTATPSAATAQPSGNAQQVMNPAQVGQANAGIPMSQMSTAPISTAPSVAPSGAQSASLDGLGSITRPAFVQSSSEIKKEFLRNAQNVNSKLDKVSSELRRSIILLAQRSSEVAESEQVSEYVNDNIRITVANVEGSGIIVGKWKDNRLVSWASAEEFGDEIVSLAASNPQEAAKNIYNKYYKESGVNMSENITTKTAAADSSQQEVVTQKQLDNAGPLHPRTNKEADVITEKQLEHTGKVIDVVTEAQLKALDGDLARWNSFPEVITQGQWDEMSRRVSSSLGDGYTSQITQAQLESLQKSHKWVAPEVITQAQLSQQKKVAPQTDSERVAASAKELIKAASNTIADAIAHYGLAPSDCVAAMNVMSADPYAQLKAGFLTLVNASPVKVASREAVRKRNNYFGKISIASNSDPIDGLLAAMGDNIGYNKAEDYIDALKYAINNKKVFAAAEENAQVKIASMQSESKTTMTKEAMFDNAFSEMNRPEDGLYKICGTLSDDVTVDPSDKSQFMKALYTFASTQIDVPFIIENVSMDKEAGVFEADCKDVSVCTDMEKKAFSNLLNSQFKIASTEKVVHAAQEENDGLYKICGTLSEDVTVDPSNRDLFMKSLYRFAKSYIQKPFVIANVDIDTDHGTFEMQCKETEVCTKAEKTAFASAIKSQFKVAKNIADSDVETTDEAYEAAFAETFANNPREARAAARKNLVKEAQFGGPAGNMGAAPAGGGGGGMMGGADMGAGGMPGAEALSTPAGGGAAGGGMPGAEGGLGGADEGDDTDMQPKPPGTVCVVCGSSDVDVLEGKCRCNNCKAEFAVKVNIDITKYPSVLDAGDNKKEEGEKGEGFAMPETGESKEPASMPIAAMTRLTTNMIKVAQESAAAQGKKWELGAISPFTGNYSTMKLEGNKFMCLDTGRSFEVHVAGVDKSGKKAIFAEWRYEPAPLTRDCDVCNRKKVAFNKALKAHGIDEEIFDSMMLTEKGKTILAMNAKGLFKTVKTASADNVINSLRKVAGFGSKFPIETCMEKIARKFGENALALSGPCEGKPLAECACKRLATAGVYANDLAIKVASIWSVEDQMVNCVEDFVRTAQFSMKEACVVCDQLKNKYAEVQDLAADAMDMKPIEPDAGGPAPTGGKPSAMDEMESETDMGSNAEPEMGPDVDPFAGEAAGETGGMVTIELPKDILENLDMALDKALGEEPEGEAHHDEGMSEMPTETPVESAEEAMGNIEKAVNSSPAENALESAENETAGTPKGLPVGETTEKEIAMSSDDEDCETCEHENGEEEESNDEESNDDGEKKDSDEENEKEEDSSDSDDEEDKEEVNHNDTHDSKPDFLKKTGDEDEDEGSKEGDKEMEKAAAVSEVFKKGRISGTGQINLDLNNVLKVLASQGKQIKQAKEVTLKNVQDSVGKIQDGKTMGHEEKFEMKKPEVPSADKKALMGGEADAGLEVVKDKPDFDAGGGEMGHEKELGYTSEKTHEMTGGNRGAGNHAASSKARTTVLAERIMKNIKTASDKKIDEAQPVSESADVGKYAEEDCCEGDVGKTEEGDASLMGHEKETIKSVPDAKKDAPSIPVGGGMNPKFDKNKENAPEMQTAVKGTVIASGDEKSLAARKEAAIKVAGRKLKAGLITIDKLAGEIEKLSRYDMSDLKDLETSLFGATKKGFDTVAGGTEKPLVISEKSNQRKVAQELKDSIQSLFTLNKSNDLAQDDPNFELKKNNFRFK